MRVVGLIVINYTNVAKKKKKQHHIEFNSGPFQMDLIFLWLVLTPSFLVGFAVVLGA